MGTIPHVSNWVDGSHTTPIASRIEVVNPATEAVIATVDATPVEVVQDVVLKSWASFTHGLWPKAGPSERYRILTKAATLLRDRIPEFVQLETQQTGRPIRELQTQLARVPEWLEYFASLARSSEGVVALITPYNHPLLIATKKIGAALAAGNVVIVKPSELAPLSVLRIGELFKEAGLPDGSLQIISGYGRETGAKVLCGGKRSSVAGRGYFYEPTLIETDAESELACNEVFGPVIAIVRCASEDDIIRIANSTEYALGASVWTNDFTQAHRVASKIDSGVVWINGHHLNDPSSPWGGFKDSGIGKENGWEAYESYTKVKSTIINYGVAQNWFDQGVESARYG
ncbi:hypothetical protein DV737_g1180, partial [Chaetothyriales sp. CBS 132003]